MAPRPLVIMPAAWLGAPISDGDFRVLAAICQYASLDSDDGCLRSAAALGERIGKSRDAIRRSIRNLRDAGYITTEPRYVDGRQSTSRIVPCWWVEVGWEGCTDAPPTKTEDTRSAPEAGGADLHPRGCAGVPPGGCTGAPPIYHPVRNTPLLQLQRARGAAEPDRPPPDPVQAVAEAVASIPGGTDAWAAVVAATRDPHRRRALASALLLAASDGIGAPGGQPLPWHAIAHGLLHASANRDGTPTVFNIVNAGAAMARQATNGVRPAQDDFAALEARLRATSRDYDPSTTTPTTTPTGATP